MTETPLQQIAVDTTPPTVEADTQINLGETIYYTLRDNGSGLWIERIVIEDEDEKYKKIVWLTEISGNKIEGDILWDGKFADKTLAGIGEYYITFKISDRAGNETFYTTVVHVNSISYLQVIPEFIPPVSDVETSNEITNDEQEQSFGGSQNQGNESTTQTFVLTSSATAGANASTTTTSNILWGFIAASAIGAATAYALEQQRQREEEEATQLAEVQASVDAQNAAIEANRIAMIEQLRIRNWLEGQATLDAWIEQLESQGASQDEIDDLREQAGTSGLSTAISNAHNLNQSLAVQQLANQQAYDIYRQGEYVSVPMQDEEDEEENPFAGLSASGGVGTSNGASKPLLSLVPQNPEPPTEHNDGVSSWWDVFDLDWWSSDEPWPWPFGPAQPSVSTHIIPEATQTSAIQTAWAQITQTAQAYFTPTPAVTSTPAPTSTPTLPNFQIYKPNSPLTAWEATIGGQVAHNAHLLLAQVNNFYFWSNDDPGTNSDPPKPLNYNDNFPISLNPNDYNVSWYGENNILQYTNGRIPFVCGDIPDQAYFMAGFNLQQIFPLQNHYQNHWPSSSYGYMTMLAEHGNLNIYSIGNNPNFGSVPELGDVIVTQTNGSNWGDPHGAGHVVVVAEVHGNTPSQIVIIDGNADHGTLEQYTVQELIDRNPDFQYLLYGHPDLPTGTP